MKGRRAFLKALGAGATYTLAGCVDVSTSDSDFSEENQPESDEDTIDPTPTDTRTLDQSDTRSPTPTKEVPLPGEPKEIRNGELPVYQVEKVVNTEAAGFAGTNEINEFTPDIDVGNDYTGLSFTPRHKGGGRASGYATGTYQTAWKAPETGKYRLRGIFHRWGGFYYDIPDAGNVMTSFDVNVQLVVYQNQRVVANQRFPQSIQSSNDRSPPKLGEFLIETGVTALASSYLGLGLVGRVVLRQIVSELIELEDPGVLGGSTYDVTAQVEKNPSSPMNISGPLKVREGTTLIFELSPMLSWSYELSDFSMEPRFTANFELESFRIEQFG